MRALRLLALAGVCGVSITASGAERVTVSTPWPPGVRCEQFGAIRGHIMGESPMRAMKSVRWGPLAKPTLDRAHTPPVDGMHAFFKLEPGTGPVRLDQVSWKTKRDGPSVYLQASCSAPVMGLAWECHPDKDECLLQKYIGATGARFPREGLTAGPKRLEAVLRGPDPSGHERLARDLLIESDLPVRACEGRCSSFVTDWAQAATWVAKAPWTPDRSEPDQVSQRPFPAALVERHWIASFEDEEGSVSVDLSCVLSRPRDTLAECTVRLQRVGDPSPIGEYRSFKNACDKPPCRGCDASTSEAAELMLRYKDWRVSLQHCGSQPEAGDVHITGLAATYRD